MCLNIGKVFPYFLVVLLEGLISAIILTKIAASLKIKKSKCTFVFMLSNMRTCNRIYSVTSRFHFLMRQLFGMLQCQVTRYRYSCVRVCVALRV